MRSLETVREDERAHKTYFGKGDSISAGMHRARKPYRFSNTVSLLVLSSMVFGIYAYSIMMVCIRFTHAAGGTRRLL